MIFNHVLQERSVRVRDLQQLISVLNVLQAIIVSFLANQMLPDLVVLVSKLVTLNQKHDFACLFFVFTVMWQKNQNNNLLPYAPLRFARNWTFLVFPAIILSSTRLTTAYSFYVYVVFAGYFCKVGVNTSKPSSEYTGLGGICYPGHECPVGTGNPSPCQQGYYSPVSKSKSCLICPEGERLLKWCSILKYRRNLSIGLYSFH